MSGTPRSLLGEVASEDMLDVHATSPLILAINDGISYVNLQQRRPVRIVSSVGTIFIVFNCV